MRLRLSRPPGAMGTFSSCAARASRRAVSGTVQPRDCRHARSTCLLIAGTLTTPWACSPVLTGLLPIGHYRMTTRGWHPVVTTSVRDAGGFLRYAMGEDSRTVLHQAGLSELASVAVWRRALLAHAQEQPARRS